MSNGFYKVGAAGRQDQLVQIGRKKWLLVFGFEADGIEADGDGSPEAETVGYNWRKNYDHKPDRAELKADVEQLVNSCTDEKSLSGFVWNGKPVWLSTENQFNFKAAYDLAVQSGGTMLPVTFKLGEDGDCNAVYHTFETMEDFTDFFTKAIQWVNGCIADGWREKDSVDYEKLSGDE